MQGEQFAFMNLGSARTRQGPQGPALHMLINKRGSKDPGLWWV